MHHSRSEIVAVVEDTSTVVDLMNAAPRLRGRAAPSVLRPAFGGSRVNLLRALQSKRGKSADRKLAMEMSQYFVADAADEDVHGVVEQVRAQPGVVAVYVKPGVENPVAVRRMMRAGHVASDGPFAPNYRLRQGYLEPAPGGIGVSAAWKRRGGQGSDVRVVDVEGGWQFTHQDLAANAGGLLAGVAYDETYWRDHGTAVFGEIGGDLNEQGVTGIAPAAILSAVSHGDLNSALAIELAADSLRPGDVLLLEMHRPGPRFNYEYRDDQRGYIAVEWWPDDFAAIRYAIARGVIVVEAAGNGAEDFDDPFYDSPDPGFPASWVNPLRGVPDSGAIIVGAGAPPNGTWDADRSRLDFSNYGKRVDCQAWGRDVVTTGYGDLFRNSLDPDNEDHWYTDTFGGTSSASPIVTGAVACLQGIAKANGRILGSRQLRTALRTSGSPQQASASAPLSQRIGPRPDLRKLIKTLGL